MPISYAACSAAVGLLQLVDGLHLWRQRGRVTKLALYVSFFEYAWAVLSVWVLYSNWGAPNFDSWLPALFVAYVAAMTTWGWVEFKDLQQTGRMPILTPNMVFVGIAFGVAFLSCSLYVALFR